MNNKERKDLYEIFIDNIDKTIDTKYRYTIFSILCDYCENYHFSFFRKMVMENLIDEVINRLYRDLNYNKKILGKIKK